MLNQNLYILVYIDIYMKGKTKATVETTQSGRSAIELIKSELKRYHMELEVNSNEEVLERLQQREVALEIVLRKLEATK